jgi:hypothetical protein
VNAELGFASGDMLGDGTARNELGLGLHLAGDPELVEQARDINAARAARRRIDIGHRLGREQCALERIDRTDVGLRRAILDHDPDADAREIGPAAGDELALVGKRIDRRRREHGEIEGLAALDAFRQRADRVVLDRHLVAGLLLEIGDERQQHLLEGTGGEHLDLRRRGAPRRTRGEQHHCKGQHSHSHVVLPGRAHLTACT